MIAFSQIYDKRFPIFANVEFAAAIVLVAVLLASAILIKQRTEEDENAITFAIIFALVGIFTLWVLISEEIYFYWYCRDRYGTATPNWQFLANMYTSIAWAVYGIVLMIVGFWRHIKTLRFAALGLFAILLVKVFIMDMSTVKSVYRIAAFLATGITLVAVSYLYQYLKNHGFFDTLSAQQKQNGISGDSK
jgi:heme/copper-type cytochrome/quinol oxidase subunit 2